MHELLDVAVVDNVQVRRRVELLVVGVGEIGDVCVGVDDAVGGE